MKSLLIVLVFGVLNCQQTLAAEDINKTVEFILGLAGLTPSDECFHNCIYTLAHKGESAFSIMPGWGLGTSDRIANFTVRLVECLDMCPNGTQKNILTKALALPMLIGNNPEDFTAYRECFDIVSGCRRNCSDTNGTLDAQVRTLVAEERRLPPAQENRLCKVNKCIFRCATNFPTCTQESKEFGLQLERARLGSALFAYVTKFNQTEASLRCRCKWFVNWCDMIPSALPDLC